MKILVPIVFGFLALVAFAAGSSGGGLICVLIALWPYIPAMLAKQKAEKEAKKQDARDTERRVREEDIKRQREQVERAEAAERDKRFQAQQKAIGDSSAATTLRGLVNEIFELTNMLKEGGDHHHVVAGIHEVLGRLLTQDIPPTHVQDKNIQFDVDLILEKLAAMGLKEDAVYRRAEKILKYQPPPPAPPMTREEAMRNLAKRAGIPH